MVSVEATGGHEVPDWVCDLHALNSVLAPAPAAGAVPGPPARPRSEPEPAADSRQWATHLVAVSSRLAVPVTARPEKGSV